MYCSRLKIIFSSNGGNPWKLITPLMYIHNFIFSTINTFIYCNWKNTYFNFWALTRFVIKGNIFIENFKQKNSSSIAIPSPSIFIVYSSIYVPVSVVSFSSKYIISHGSYASIPASHREETLMCRNFISSRF